MGPKGGRWNWLVYMRFINICLGLSSLLGKKYCVHVVCACVRGCACGGVCEGVQLWISVLLNV